ncbi:MAG TPA: MgtC/SapB family protein [Synergistales bacterium]|jgi:putative Mg2+ transporter-C (MgtC) family protein|nr:magnesium transporter [Synergistaceae bacterium]HQO83402.1 MgtC/SapB family protein [Synergistales bacterium]
MGLENQIIILGKVALAILLGGLIGLEREMIGKPTGMRTHMLIAGASTLFAAMGSVITNYFAEVTCGTELVRSDPIRVIQAIALGISFIGAGTIMQHPERRKVIYLTSAASILFTAGVGIAVAVDHFLVAIGCVAIVWIVNRGLRYIDKKVLKKRAPLSRTRESDLNE